MYVRTVFLVVLTIALVSPIRADEVRPSVEQIKLIRAINFAGMKIAELGVRLMQSEGGNPKDRNLEKYYEYQRNNIDDAIELMALLTEANKAKEGPAEVRKEIADALDRFTKELKTARAAVNGIEKLPPPERLDKSRHMGRMIFGLAGHFTKLRKMTGTVAAVNKNAK